MTTHDRAARPRFITARRRLMLLIAGMGAVVALAASASLRDRSPAAPRPSPPLTVPTVAAFQISNSEQFTREHAYVGRVEPARRVDVGFELAGRLLRIRVDEGDAVQRGQRLAELDTERLVARRRELDAQVRLAGAELELARSTRERIRDLSGQGHASRQRRDEAEERFDAARAALALAKARVESLGTELSKSELRAPFDALVVSRYLDEGRVVAAATPVLSLQEQQRPQARIGLPSRTADRIESGRDYTLRIAGREYRARLRTVLPVAGGRARTVDAVFDIAADPGELRVGELAEIDLSQTVRANGAWVPLSALTTGYRGTWVLYALRSSSDHVADLAEVIPLSVELLAQDGRRAYVRGASIDDQRIVAHGLNRIVPGQRVRISTHEGGVS